MSAAMIVEWRRGFYNPRDSHPTAWHRVGEDGRPACGARWPRGDEFYFRSDNLLPRVGPVCEKCEEME